VLEELLKAFDARPNRAEPLHELARYYREKKRYGRAYIFAKTGNSIPRPVDTLFVAEEVYAWRMLDELAVAAYWIGRFAESKACCEEILRRAGPSMRLAAEDVKRIQQNLAFANAKLEWKSAR